MLASLSLNSSLGEALFSTGNIEQTFGIIFNIFYHHGDDRTALSHAVDLMAVLLACERIRTAFVGYKHLRACVQSTLTLLVRSTGESAGKLCELFQAFLSVPELHQMIVNTFLGPLCNVDRRRGEGVQGVGHGSSLVAACLLPMMGGGREGGATRRCTNRALDLLREVMEVGPLLWNGAYTYVRTCEFLCVYVCLCAVLCCAVIHLHLLPTYSSGCCCLWSAAIGAPAPPSPPASIASAAEVHCAGQER